MRRLVFTLFTAGMLVLSARCLHAQEQEDLVTGLKQAVHKLHEEFGNTSLRTKIMRIELWSLDGRQYASVAVLHKHTAECPPNVDCTQGRHLAETMREKEGPTPPGIYDYNSLTGTETYSHLVVLHAGYSDDQWTVHTAPEGISFEEDYLEEAARVADRVVQGLTFDNHTL